MLDWRVRVAQREVNIETSYRFGLNWEIRKDGGTEKECCGCWGAHGTVFKRSLIRDFVLSYLPVEVKP